MHQASGPFPADLEKLASYRGPLQLWTREDTASLALPLQERVKILGRSLPIWAARWEGGSPPTGFLQGRERLGGLRQGMLG